MPKKKKNFWKGSPKFQGQIKSPVGRPEKIKPDEIPQISEDLINHMASGKSFESFAGKLNIGIQTLYNYSEKYPELMEAKTIGVSKCMEFWEELGIKGTMGVVKGFNAVTWSKNVACRFPMYFREKREIEANINNTIDIRNITEQDYIEALRKDKFLTVIECEGEDLPNDSASNE